MKNWRNRTLTTALLAMTGVMVGGGIGGSYWNARGEDEPAATSEAATPSPADMKQALSAYQAAKQLFDAHKYTEADVENEKALSLNPGLNDARVLKQRLAARLSETPIGTVDSGATKNAALTSAEYLSPEQIFRIRLAELSGSADFNSKNRDIRGSVPRKALQKFWDDVYRQTSEGKGLSNRDRDAFLNPANFTEQIRLIKQYDQTGEFLSQIKLESDPVALKGYKTKIQPFLLQNCATSDCHGGKNNKTSFQLYGTPGKVSDAQTYTNFYLINKFSKNGFYMLDRQQPDQSLFIQYALAQGSKVTHPGKATAIKLKLTGRDDVRYQNIIDVIGSLNLPQPSYGFIWNPPLKTPSTTAPTPTTGPATLPAPKP